MSTRDKITALLAVRPTIKATASTPSPAPTPTRPRATANPSKRAHPAEQTAPPKRAAGGAWPVRSSTAALAARIQVEPATRPAVAALEGDNRDDIVDEDIYRASNINANDGDSNDDGGRDTDGNEDNDVGGREDNND
ncbi:hypothetical protein SPI_06111 [Niveomyces insectorum RCEF 264]|uniref:Uncharacterized protein n=1 Tax=Niveomyces insectorum RCEF 264 TaxID=1081102 RepID=A0A167RT18_9HYPO|nr:hypothetical protein SPI_06111 [Niveomyces insectorum RCEF 264]